MVMTSHLWGDDWPYWDQLNGSINRICHRLVTYGRIGCHGKEKYGTFRDHTWFWDGSLYHLFYPGYVWIKPMWRWWYFNVDIGIGRWLARYSGVMCLVHLYQSVIYNWAIQAECRRCPEITDELVSNIDWPEKIKPGFFGTVDGKKIHDKYWVTYTHDNT
jgi:hypothetical protein